MKEKHKDKSTHIYQKGYDVFLTEPGISDEMKCRVCGKTCDVRRNVTGPTGHISAISGNHTLHDSFNCPSAGEDWHNKAVKLVKAIEDTPSQTISDIMSKDLKDILEKSLKKPSK
jgi:hypothetical protein